MVPKTGWQGSGGAMGQGSGGEPPLHRWMNAWAGKLHVILDCGA